MTRKPKERRGKEAEAARRIILASVRLRYSALKLNALFWLLWRSRAERLSRPEGL